MFKNCFFQGFVAPEGRKIGLVCLGYLADTHPPHVWPGALEGLAGTLNVKDQGVKDQGVEDQVVEDQLWPAALSAVKLCIGCCIWIWCCCNGRPWGCYAHEELEARRASYCWALGPLWVQIARASTARNQPPFNDFDFPLALAPQRRANLRSLTSKSAPTPPVVDDFGFSIVFVPQRGANFGNILGSRSSAWPRFSELTFGNARPPYYGKSQRLAQFLLDKPPSCPASVL